MAVRRWFPDTVQPGSHWTATTSSFTASVLFRRGHADIHRRQNREDIRLNNRNKDVQPNERQGQYGGKNSQDDAQRRSLGPTPEGRSGKQAEENAVNHVAGEDIGPKADGEGEKTSRGADNFNREKQQGKRPVRDLPLR